MSKPRGGSFVGEMPKILVNGSSNFSIVDSCEAADKLYKHKKSTKYLLEKYPQKVTITSVLPKDDLHVIKQQRRLSDIQISDDIEFTAANGKPRRDSKSQHRRDSKSQQRRRSSCMVLQPSDGSSLPGSRRHSTTLYTGNGDMRRHSRVSSKHTQIVEITPEMIEKDRRHKFVVTIVMGTFFFIVCASVLVVVITLTHHKPQSQNSSTQFHVTRRFHHENIFPTVDSPTEELRKENEELMHSLSYNHAHNRSKLLTTLAPPEVIPE